MYQLISHSISIKHYKFLAIVITLCLLTACSKKVESHNADPSYASTSISDSLRVSEGLFAERSDISKLRTAVNTLGLARNPDQRHYEVEWKFAKYSYFLGKVEPLEEDAIAAFEKGRDAGKIASRVDPSKADGHFWYGANLGELGRISPVTVGIKSVDDIREAMNASIAIEPNYQNGSAYDGLGQLEMATRTLKGGTIEKAIEYYEKGLEISPDNANLRLHLAEAYLAAKDEADAKKQLNALFALTPNPAYEQEHKVAVEKGRALMSKNF
ncbi:MAG: tetratricopeptide repeat protein [Pyrinomonadaceae bacterium]